MRDPTYVSPNAPATAASKDAAPRPADLTRDERAFKAAIRARVFAWLRAWSTRNDEEAVAMVPGSRHEADGAPWTLEDLRAARSAHDVEHRGIRLDPEARNFRHTVITKGDNWRVEQMLIDPDGLNDWMAVFEVDVAASRADQEARLRLVRLGPFA